MTNKFIKIRCNKCKKEQTMFEKASTPVKCNSCNEEIATPKGGKAQVTAKTLEILK